MAMTRKTRGIISLLIALAAAVTVGLYVLRRENQADQEKYRTEPVTRGDVSMTVIATGSISAVTTVQVGSQVSGIIARLYADFNSPVKKGQLLAELDPTPFEAIVAQRRADLAGAEVQLRNNGVTFERMKRLLKEDLVAQSDYDAAKAAVEASAAQVQQANAALSQAMTNLGYTNIRSPIDGVVVDRQYDIGQTVAASFQAPTLFTIAQDLKRTQVQADVDQSDIGRVEKGQTARFTVDAYPGERFQGKVTQVRLNATVNQNVITYPVIIEVPNPEEKLRPKMTADTSIEVATVKDVLRIPNAALRFRPTDVDSSGGKGSSQRAGGGGGNRASAGSARDGREVNTDGAGRSAAGAGRSADGTGKGADQAGEGGSPAPGRGGDRASGLGARGGRRAGGADGPGRTNRDGGGSDRTGAGAGSSGEMSSDAAATPGIGMPGAGTPGAEGGIAGAARAFESGRLQRGESKPTHQIYVLTDRGQLRPLAIRTGITDGRYTQVLEGDIKPGEKVVVGLVTARAEAGGISPFGGGAGPGGGPGGGRRGGF